MLGISVVIALALPPGAPSAALAAKAPGLDPGKALTQYSLDVWTTADALPQNSVTTIVQTRDGYLWLGTYGGLVRFDGVRFTVFDVASGALRSNGVQALLEDREGALWIGTNGGGLTRHQGGRFQTFTKADGLAHDIVRALHQDRAGAIWVGTNDGLTRIADGGYRSFTTKDGLANGVVRAIVEDGEGTLWIGTNGGGLDRFRDGRFEHLTTRDGLPNDFVFALLIDRAGALWIGTNGGGLARLVAGKLRTFRVSDGLPGDIIWSLHEDALGSIWVGTYGAGIARLREGRFESLTTQEGLPNDFVRTLHSDREGSLWVGTYSGGLCRLRDGKFTTYTRSEGLSYDFVRTAFEDREGTLWVGTTGGGLCRRREGRFRCLGPREGMAPDVRALHQSPDGSLWVGTSGAGLVRMAKDRLVSYTRADGLPHPNVTAITDDGEGGLWLGTNGGGLARFHGGKFHSLPASDGLAGNFVLSLLRDRRGTLWAGTDGAGLSRFQDGASRTYTTRDGLGSDIVFAIHEDAQGGIWIGTSGGLSRYRDGLLTTLGPAQGLIDDVVFSVLEDGAGDFWLGGNRGISRVSRAELEEVAKGARPRANVLIYGRADGMRSDECSGVAQPASWRGRDGRLYFPTAKGVVVVDPARMPRNTVPPPVHVEEVVVDGQPLAGLEIPPGRQRFEFRYTALSLLAPRKVQFRYRLEGFDTEWIEAGSLRTAYYTRLPPGPYTFRVKASNNDGVWNEEGAALQVVVRPFFWETRAFRALVALGLMAFGALAYALRVRRLEHAHRVLEGLVEARTADLVREKERSEAARAEAELERTAADRQREIAQEADRLKGELLSIAAHDLKTPLQSIIGYSELLLEQPSGERVREYAAHGARAAQRMLDIVHKMLQSDAIESGLWRPVQTVVDLGRLGLATSGILQPQAEAKKQRIHAAAQEGCRVEGDEDWLRQVLENLLGNAIKYSPERRSIWLDVRREGDKVRLAVKDEGPGLSDDDKARIFGRFQRLSARPTGGESSTGLGLSIVRQLLDRHDGRVWAESEGRGKGATFFVELPALDGPAKGPGTENAEGTDP